MIGSSKKHHSKRDDAPVERRQLGRRPLRLFSTYISRLESSVGETLMVQMRLMVKVAKNELEDHRTKRAGKKRRGLSTV